AFLARLAPLAALRSGHRTPAVSRTRRRLYQLGIRHLGYPGAAVARFLGVTTSAPNRAAWPLPEPGVTALL
ncbi:MAG TPA: hypothetical protein VEU07_01035, partial [Candidatus Acidoferrum sp.]|nr:hypothetical protein [Candidatus Acidoferrum sp.]